jgi:CRP-like cAMP-binding protein
MLRVSAETEDGQRVTLSVLGPGESIGEMALLDDSHRSATVEAVEDSTILVIDRNSFHVLIRSRPDLALLIMRNLSRRLRQRTADIVDIAYLDVYRRLSRKLLQLAEEQGDRVPDGICIKAPLAIETLATMIGAEEEGVAHLVTMLENEGTLSHCENHITVHDLHRLHERFFTPRVLKRTGRNL